MRRDYGRQIEIFFFFLEDFLFRFLLSFFVHNFFFCLFTRVERLIALLDLCNGRKDIFEEEILIKENLIKFLRMSEINKNRDDEMMRKEFVSFESSICAEDRIVAG